MYIYKGFNKESKEKITKEFEDDYDASSFARENAFQYPQFIITDSDNDDEVVDSDKIAQGEEDSSMDNMFPDEESKEGFDVNDFFEKD